MTSITSNNMANKSLQTTIDSKRHYRTAINATIAVSIICLSLFITGCNTTQGFKPTASVMVGGQTSL